MKKLLPVACAAALSACGYARIDVQYRPTGQLEPLRVAHMPKLYVPEVEDRLANGFVYGGVGGTPSGQLVHPITDTLHEAVENDLRRLSVPVTASRDGADAVLKAALTAAAVTMHPGVSAPADAAISAAFQLRSLAGDLLWSTEITGKGSLPAFAPGVPGRVPSDAMNVAFANMMRKFAQALEEESVLSKVFGKRTAAPAPVARAESEPHEEPAPAAPARLKAAKSDLDDLPAPRSPRHAHAVVIGIERYREKLPDAEFAAGDARLAAEYFKRVLGVPEENVALLVDDRATKSDFEKYFGHWLSNRVERGDEVYVYYSGHGAPNPKTGDAYLVPYDADPTYIEDGGYPIKTMYEQLSKLPAKKIVVAMDSCFSGAGGRSVIARGVRPLVAVQAADIPPNLTVISASAGDQISNSLQDKGHGLFTYFFLKGLKTKGDDLRDVFDYLKPEVSRIARREYNADQEPQWRGAR